MSRPKEGTEEYYEWLEKVMPYIESKLPVIFHGVSYYCFSHYWKNTKTGQVYDNMLVHTPVDIFEILLNEEL